MPNSLCLSKTEVLFLYTPPWQMKLTLVASFYVGVNAGFSLYAVLFYVGVSA